MKKNKKGVAGTQGIAMVVLLIAAGALIYGVYFITKGEAPPTGSVALSPSTPVTGLVSCPSDSTVDGQIRYQDTLAATNTYGNPTCYFEPKTTGYKRVTSGTVQTDGTYSTAVNLACTEAGIVWNAVCVTSQNSYHSSVEGVDFIAEGSYQQRDLKGKAFNSLQIKIEDKFAGGAQFFVVLDQTSTNNSGYMNFNGSTLTFTDAETYTSLKVDSDEYIDAKIYLKTNATKSQFGEDGLRTFLLVDADGGSWSEPIVALTSQPALSDVLSQMMDEDRRFYSGYEYAYEIGPIGDRETTIDFYLQTASGVDPTGSNDPSFDICSEGRYNSNKVEDTILVGCYTDAATQVQVTTGLRHKVTFDVTA